jgi:hypothetical protein
MPRIPALCMLMQKNLKLEASLATKRYPVSKTKEKKCIICILLKCYFKKMKLFQEWGADKGEW